VALPIFRPIIEAIWDQHIAPKAPLNGPSVEAKADLVDIPIDYTSGDRGNGANFIEHFRRSTDGQIADTQYQLVSRESAYASRTPPDQDQGGSWWGNQNQNYQSYQGYQYYQGNQGYHPDAGYYYGEGPPPANDGHYSAGRGYPPYQTGRPAQPPPPQPARGLFGMPWGNSDSSAQPAQRRDPYYYSGGRYN
jgi:hypothetical protein